MAPIYSCVSVDGRVREDHEVRHEVEPWTVRRLASHALNNQLFWAGTVTGKETPSFEATMGAEPYDGDLGQFVSDVARRAIDMWRTDGIFDTLHVTPLGEVPGTVVINFAIIDALCHAWMSRPALVPRSSFRRR